MGQGAEGAENASSCFDDWSANVLRRLGGNAEPFVGEELLGDELLDGKDGLDGGAGDDHPCKCSELTE